jgi:aminopeptidase N
VKVEQSFDPASKKVTLTLSQSTPDTPGQKGSEKLPFHIPVVVGFLDRETGREILPSKVKNNLISFPPFFHARHPFPLTKYFYIRLNILIK